MNIIVLSILIFLVTMALAISGVYLLVVAPAEKRKLRQRIDLINTDLASTASAGAEAQLLRSEVLSGIPVVHRILLKIPNIARLQLFIQQSATDMTVGMLLTLSLLAGWLAFLASLLFGLPVLL